MLAGYAALSEARKQYAETIALFFEKSAERLGTLKGILNEKTYENLRTLTPLPESPVQPIKDEIESGAGGGNG